MRYDVYGAYEIKRNPDRTGIFNAEFWQQCENDDPGLSSACGCYVFCLRNGDNTKPWYVGKTEKATFKKECFQPTKISYYNEALSGNGVPVLFLVARLTQSGQRFSRPTGKNYRDVDYLESMLIGMALKRNGNIFNVQKTKLLRDMIVPGVINSPQSPPTTSQRSMKSAFGLV